MFLKDVLTFIFFIILYWGNISLVSGVFSKKWFLKSIFCNLQKLHMVGHSDIPILNSEIDIDQAFDENQLKSYIETAYKTLRCSYIAEAQNYINSVETVLLWENETSSLTDIAGMTFTDEASRMLATMFHVGEMGTGIGQRDTGTKDVIFIFYMYTERLKEHFMAAITGNISKDSEVISKEHKTVNCFLNKWMSEGECATFKYKTCFEPRPNWTGSMEKLLWNIKSQKQMIAKRLTNNSRLTIKDNDSVQFSLKFLTLNGVVLNTHIMDKLFDTFPVHVDWDPLMDLLKRQLENAKRMSGNFLSEQIRSLSSYQYVFIQMMKVVVTRLTLKYVMYLNTVSSSTDRNQYSKLYNDEVLKRITDFEEFFQLPDDKDLVSLKKIFKTSTFSKSVQYYIQSIQNVLTDISSRVIKNEGLASPMYLSQDFKSSNPLISILIEDSVRILTRFMVHIKEMLFEINFRVIQSFIRIPTTKEFQSLLYYENN